MLAKGYSLCCGLAQILITLRNKGFQSKLGQFSNHASYQTALPGLKPSRQAFTEATTRVKNASEKSAPGPAWRTANGTTSRPCNYATVLYSLC